ncbi:MAG TPA: hypothetical protein VH278_16825 [Burkholderiaceae bacterium]|jgi:hypothetical protein|nr:hypothetical protein [Burkholderiaceae bacterium]
MSSIRRLNACLGFTALALASGPLLAQEHPFTEGAVVNVARIRTENGHFDDYMKYVATTWKAEQEAAKKAGYILDYQVITVEPRGPDDADLLLITTYKNWAALDGSIEKGDAVAKQIEGSVAASNQGALDRNKIRRVLGSATMQVLNLK